MQLTNIIRLEHSIRTNTSLKSNRKTPSTKKATEMLTIITNKAAANIRVNSRKASSSRISGWGTVRGRSRSKVLTSQEVSQTSWLRSQDLQARRKNKTGAHPIEQQIQLKELSATWDQALPSLKRPRERAKRETKWAGRAVTLKSKEALLKWDSLLKIQTLCRMWRPSRISFCKTTHSTQSTWTQTS